MDALSNYSDESIFVPEMFYALADGVKCRSDESPNAMALLGLLCRCFGERQVVRENFQSASALFDLEFIISCGQPSEGVGAVFCDRCMVMIETKARYKCVCMQCTFSPGGCYDLCFSCFDNAFNPTIGAVHHQFVKIPSSSNAGGKEQLFKLKMILQAE